jgi:hypothetical protein
MEEYPANPEATIQLPSRLRLLQRLGQVTTSATARGNLSSRIASHEREKFTPEGFVDMLAGHMHEYAEEQAMGIDVLLYNRMPSYIKTILDKDSDKRQALEYWTEKVQAEKGTDSPSDSKDEAGLSVSKGRAFRSQQQSAQAARIRAAREAFHKPSARRQPWQR